MSILRDTSSGRPHRPLLRGPAIAVLTAGLVSAGLGVAGPADASTPRTVTPTSTTLVSPNATASLAGLAVSGYDPAESLQVTLATTVGTMSIGHTAGTELAFGNAWSGDASVTFTAKQSDANAALDSATLSSGDNVGQTASVSLTVSPADDTRVYLPQNQHYYEYVPSPSITWTAADAAAKTRQFQGQRGYLATIPNATVNSFIQSRIEGAVNVWFGARAYDNDGGGHARTWRWAKGADESPLQGQVQQYCDYAGYNAVCRSQDNNGRYGSWANGEPNNAGQNCQYDEWDDFVYGCTGGEDFPVTNYGGQNGLWNDFPNDIGAQSSGYVVEYGDEATGSSGFDDTVTKKSDVLIADAPGAPTDVAGTAGDGSAEVSFTAPAANGAEITGYTVITSPGNASTSCTASPCSVTGLTNGTSYTFSVVATNGVGDSSPSASSDAVVPRGVPGAPTGVTATRGNGEASVAFVAPVSNNGATIASYTVTSSPDGKTATCTGSPCVVENLTNGTPYTFTVMATNVAGNSAVSAASTAVTPATVPGAPSAVVATRGNGSASVTFAAPSGDGGSAITTYTVTSAPGGKTAQCDGVSSCIVTGLTNGTSYTFSVTATNDVGTGDASGPSDAITPATTPSAPSITSVTSRAGGLTVRFTAPMSNGSEEITGYEYSFDDDHWFPLTTTAGNPLAGTIDELTNGTAYPVRVRAANTVGKGSSSASVTATPATTPDAPSAVTAKAGNKAVTVTWTAPADDGGADITGYTVTAQPGGATCTTTGATTCTFPNLPPGKSYRFTVKASNAIGDGTATGVGTGSASTPSAPVRPTGLPSRPQHLRVSPGDRTLTISYAAPVDDGGSRIKGYQVSIDGGTHWLAAGTTGTVRRGVLNGTTFRVLVRAVNAHGVGAATPVVTATTRQWFHDPISKKARKALRAVPANPSRYRGKLVATRAKARAHNGTPAVPAPSLHGRQLQRGQAAALGTDGLFAFDRATLNAAGKRQVRLIATSLRYVRSFVCEGYADYGGSSKHQQVLSRQRAKALCSALSGAGAKGRSTAKGYGASRPAVVGGSPFDRAGNRRVVVLVTG